MLNSMVRLQQNNLIYAMCAAENIQQHVPCNSVKPWLHFLITQLTLLETNAPFASSDQKQQFKMHDQKQRFEMHDQKQQFKMHDQKQRFEMLDLIGILKCTIKNSDLVPSHCSYLTDF
jgi:hypothetical protein